jgi:multiple sugar transport system permease protein
MSSVAAPRVTTATAGQTATAPRRKRTSPARVFLYAFLIISSVVWLFPVLWALFNSFRNYSFTQTHGYLSFGGFTFKNYVDAWEQGDFTRHFLNSAIITIPAVVLTLLLSTMVAFVVARFTFKFNIALLGLFTAANLLPPQALLIPLFRFFRSVNVPFWLNGSGTLFDSYWALIAVNTAFQTGFCTFVLSNYMKTLPKELYEAAEVDGLSIFRQYWQITIPLVRPALAALSVLEITWIYNEFFWATVLMSSGDKLPITSSLNNLKGQFFTDYNLLSAGSILVALPTLIVFFLLQKQFISGLTLGATKG